MTDLCCMQLNAQWHVFAKLSDRHRTMAQAMHKRRVSMPQLLPCFQNSIAIGDLIHVGVNKQRHFGCDLFANP